MLPAYKGLGELEEEMKSAPVPLQRREVNKPERKVMHLTYPRACKIYGTMLAERRGGYQKTNHSEDFFYRSLCNLVKEHQDLLGIPSNTKGYNKPFDARGFDIKVSEKGYPYVDAMGLPVNAGSLVGSKVIFTLKVVPYDYPPDPKKSRGRSTGLCIKVSKVQALS